jgi:hypothetical protein
MARWALWGVHPISNAPASRYALHGVLWLSSILSNASTVGILGPSFPVLTFRFRHVECALDAARDLALRSRRSLSRHEQGSFQPRANEKQMNFQPRFSWCHRPRHPPDRNFIWWLR